MKLVKISLLFWRLFAYQASELVMVDLYVAATLLRLRLPIKSEIYATKSWSACHQSL